MRVNRKQLLERLQAVSLGLSVKEQIEQSSSFVFQDGKIKTFNDEIACSIPSDLDIEGAVIGGPLISFLRKLSVEDVELEIDKGELRIKAGRSKAGIRVAEVITLPVGSIEEPKKWRIIPNGFIDAIKMVQSCASTDESESVLTCIHIHPEWIEAANQYQIIRHSCKTGFSKSFLVKQIALKGVVSTDVSEYSQTDNWLHFRNSNGLVLSCRRNTESYPKLDKFLSVEGIGISFPKDLEKVVGRANVFSSQNADVNYVQVELRSHKLKISGIGDSGWFSEVQEVEYEGENIKFSIAPQLLVDISNKSGECKVSSGKLRVQTPSWIFVTCTIIEEDN